MNIFYTFVSFILISEWFIQDAVSQNFTSEEKAKDPDGRRGLFILDNSGKTSDGQHLTSHKVETKTYTTRVSSSGGSGGLQGWVSQTQNEGNVLQPQIQSIIQSQPPCSSGANVLASSGGQASILAKKSTVASSQLINGGSSINSMASSRNQWQSGPQGIRVARPLVVGQLGGQSSLVQGSSSQVTTSNLNDVTGVTLTDNNRGVKNTYETVDNIQNQARLLNPDSDSFKVSIISSGDGIYANELTGQQTQNLNMRIPTESNSRNIVAVPVMKSQLGHAAFYGYRPNIQYYLRQIEANNIIKNPSAIQRVPSFIEHIKPDQININLSEDQLKSYKQYLIQTGLIKLKPYQLIFSEQFRPQLKSLQWMAVPLESNSEYCKQRCGNLFTRNTLYSTIAENVSKLPVKLLVPVLRIRNGLQKAATGAQTIASGVGDISGGMYRMLKDSPSHIAGLVKQNSDDNKTEN